MKNILKAARTILVTAWYGAITIFCSTVVLIVFFEFVDKVLNNKVFATVVLSLILVFVTLCVGYIVREKIKLSNKEE